MNRARISLAASLLAICGAGILADQATPTPPMQSVLAGRKLTPPAKGEVIVEFLQPVSKPGKQGAEPTVITTLQVRNPGLEPIARLQIQETWFDKGGQIVGAGKGQIDGLFQPGEIKTITIESNYKPSFNANSWNFTHANGTVKPKKVAKLTPPAAGAAAAGAKPAAAPAKK